MMTIAERLARRVAAASADRITPAGLALIRTALVDTIGVMIAGAGSDPARIARQTIGPAATSGASLIIGTDQRTNALDAGLVNGVAAHALDYDDGNSIMGGHPSTMLVPAILALAEELDASADDTIVAYAAGYEVLIQLSRGLNPYHYQHGWHPTATIGIFGVAAASAKLLGLGEAATGTALAIAASNASGIKANFGTMVKSFHVGHAVRDGIFCARLAANGFTANLAALEANQGFLNVFNGRGNYDANAIASRLDDELEVNRCINPVKVFPCCASTHSAIDGALRLREAHGLRADDIERISVVVDERRIPHTDRAHLQEPLSGKFSVQYLVSRAIVDGEVSLGHFETGAHRDPAILDLMSRVSVSAAPPGGPFNSFDATVTITGRGGQTFQSPGGRRLVGMSGEQMMASADLWSKFDDCASRVFASDRVALIAQVLQSFGGSAGVRDLMRLLERCPAMAPGLADAA